MKKFLRLAVVIVFATSASSTAVAQKNDLNLKSISKILNDKGYWVIETNIKTPKTSTVHFYTIENTLMYSEKVDGIKLDAKRSKTVKLLNNALLQTLLSWHKEKMQQQDMQLVKNILKK